MTELQTIFYNCINWSEGICALTALLFFNKLKNTYWKWFVIYLVFIFVSELFSIYILKYNPNLRLPFYNYLIIPLEFVFFYWLYAEKSLQFKKLFWWSLGIYFLFFGLYIIKIEFVRTISSMSYTVGNLLLLIMVFLEILKQIKSDEILNFKSNKMFYINIGVLLFYLGTLPFFALDKSLFVEYKNLWSCYHTYFLFSLNTMYLFFTASFIWGKSEQ